MVQLKQKVSEYTNAEKNNLDLMLDVKKQCEKTYKNYADDKLWCMAYARIKVIEAQQITEDKASELEDLTKKEILTMLDDNDYNYIQVQDLYIIFKENEWHYVKPQTLKKVHMCFQIPKSLPIFHQIMNEANRNFINTTYTFSTVPEHTLNLMRKDNWLKPKEGKCHEYFDVLLDSLSGGKFENKEHIEHVIAWKYLHPENFLIPCVNIYGEGGVGKGILVNSILKNIFTAEQVQTTTKQHVLGDFNSIIAGKTIVMVDEISATTTEMATFKALVGNKDFTVNEKGIKQYNADMTALFFTGSNDVLSAIKIAGDGSDRRWSILKVEQGKGLQYWLDHHDVICDIEEFVKVLSDQENVAKWLYNICEKYKHKGCPKALHEEDYHELLENQKSELQELLEIIFSHKDFTAIKSNTIWLLYQEMMEKDNPNWSGRNKIRTLTETKSWVGKHHPNVIFRKKKKIKIYGNYTTTSVFFDSKYQGKVPETSANFENSIINILNDQGGPLSKGDQKVADLGILLNNGFKEYLTHFEHDIEMDSDSKLIN